MRETPGMRTFQCRRCGNCCRVAGYVRLAPGEAEQLASFLELDVRAFTDGYTRLTQDRGGLSLTEQADGSCVFLSGQGLCRVEEVKPRQCRRFPLHWRFEGHERICLGAKADLFSAKEEAP